MTKDEHNQLLTELRSAETDVDRMNIIVKLENDYTGVLGELDTATTTASSLKDERDKYAKLNNELWLQNSKQDVLASNTLAGTNNNQTESQIAQKRTFADLADKINQDYRR